MSSYSYDEMLKRAQELRAEAERQYPGLLDELATLTGKSPEELDYAITYTTSNLSTLHLNIHATVNILLMVHRTLAHREETQNEQ